MMKKIKVTLEWEDISIYFTNYTFFLKDKTIFKEWIFIFESHPLR